MEIIPWRNLVAAHHSVIRYMNVTTVIYSLSIIVWLLPPIRQHATKYFLFFLILAVCDPLYLLMIQFVSINPIKIFLVTTMLLILSVTIRKYNMKTLSLTILLISILIVVDIFFSIKEIYFFKILLSSILVFLFAKETVLVFNKTLKINLFYLILTLYEISIVLKFLSFLFHSINESIILFYITSAFEILIGVFFCICTVDKCPKFKLFPKSYLKNEYE